MFQVESIGVEEFFSRLDNLLEDRIESAVATALNSQHQQSSPNNDDLLTRKDVAKLFGISLTTLNEWCKVGILNPHKIGRRVFFKKNEVESALVAKNANK